MLDLFYAPPTSSQQRYIGMILRQRIKTNGIGLNIIAEQCYSIGERPAASTSFRVIGRQLPRPVSPTLPLPLLITHIIGVSPLARATTVIAQSTIKIGTKAQKN